MHRVMRIEAVRWVVAQEMAHVAHIQVYVAKHSEGEQRGNAVRAEHRAEVSVEQLLEVGVDGVELLLGRP